MGRKRNESSQEANPRQKRKTTESQNLDEAHEELSIEDSAGSGFICSYCETSCKTSTGLNSHIHDWHTLESVINTSNSAIVVRRQDNGIFLCSACRYSCPTKSGIRKHLLDKRNVLCLEQEELMSKNNTTNQAPTISFVKSPTVWRSFNEAILHASNEASSSVAHQRKTLTYAERLHQFPLGLSFNGTELNALVPLDVFSLIPDKPTLAIVNKPTRQDGEDSPDFIEENLRSLPLVMEFIEKSGFGHIIGTRKYKELSKKYCLLLNKNWDRFPQAGFVASQILAGAILVNSNDMSSILFNETETFGRNRTADSHNEQLGVRKGEPRKTSVPSTTGEDFYRGVHPVTLVQKDGQRLVIGTNTCDILVTSCVRLDNFKENWVSVGGETLNYVIPIQESKNIRIFLDAECIKIAKRMLRKSVSEITENMGVENLRQIRTKFDIQDTFNQFRCSGPLTNSILYRPNTVFTLANFGNGEKAQNAAGFILNKVGISMINGGESSALPKDVVLHCKEICSPNSLYFDLICEIEGLYSEDDRTIPIIGNKALDKILTNLAESLSRKITEANKNAVTNIKDDGDIHVVEKIVAHRSAPKGKEVEYYVKWEGFPSVAITWQPESSFIERKSISDYWDRYPNGNVQTRSWSHQPPLNINQTQQQHKQPVTHKNSKKTKQSNQNNAKQSNKNNASQAKDVNNAPKRTLRSNRV
ncbi:hypothetical protein BGX21_004183 [Mortierella sp. AD011]|nr:hypothetical protein BGX20_004733 [Mortierella sp. AD010]KAF9374249.1 hypothetical protein BGX21_004183 [Mortierella sp. AD011]